MPVCLAARQPSAPKADVVRSFSSRSELVLVPVVVTDRSGVHVGGLKLQDFVLTDNGKVQQVRLFEETKSSGERPVAKATLQAEEFSNILQQQQSPKRLVIIALDTINTRMVDQAYARNQLFSFLANNVDPNAVLVVLKITRGDKKIVHDATVDPALLVAALN